MIRASGRHPSWAARDALARTTAAPPSVMPDALPAVMMPGCPSTSPKTGASLRSESIVVPDRGNPTSNAGAGSPSRARSSSHRSLISRVSPAS